MTTPKGTMVLLALVLFSILNFPYETSAALKPLKLHAPCSTNISPSSSVDADSSYEDEDDEEELNMWSGVEHMYRKKRESGPDTEDECDENHNLKCINGTCQIHCHGEHHIFDSIQEKCLGKAGHVCGRQGKQRFCVGNAECILSYCHCVKGYGDKDGFCVKASNYSESCSAERPCDKKSGMDCLNGTCECAFGYENQWYEPSSQTCYSYPEGECTSDALCSNNSLCSVADIDPDSLVQSAIDNIYVKRCQCSRGFIRSEKSKSCLATWGVKCHNTPCHENFKCAEGKCQCHNPSYQVLDNTTNQCVGLIGSHCTVSEDPTVRSCVDNAECLSGICKCKKGYSSSIGSRLQGNKGKCLLDFGQPCQYAQFGSNCNLHRGLYCLNGVCDCVDSVHVYNNATQSCILPGRQQSPDIDTDIAKSRSKQHYSKNSPHLISSSTKHVHHANAKFICLIPFLFSYWNVFIL